MDEELNYEEILTEIKTIERTLNNPDPKKVTIDELIKLHHRGLELIQKCEESLKKAEFTVTEVKVEYDKSHQTHTEDHRSKITK